MTEWIPWPVLAVLLGFIAVAAVASVFESRRERRRIDDLGSWAGTRGFTLEPGLKLMAESGLSPDMVTLPLFKRGRSQRVRNLARGTGSDGQALLVFDFRYVVSSGKNSHSHEQTVVAFNMPNAALPAFDLKPEGLFERIGQTLGDPDIDFDSSPEFSRQYQLRSRDQDTTRRLFEPRAVPYLASSPGWSVEGSGSWLVVFQNDTRQPIDHLSEFLESTTAVMRTLAAR